MESGGLNTTHKSNDKLFRFQMSFKNGTKSPSQNFFVPVSFLNGQAIAI